MNSVIQMEQRDNSLTFDSGMELIWFLEDAYEQKNAEKFLSVVSFDFKKDFLRLKAQLEKDFSEIERLNLYVLLVSKHRDFFQDTCSYDICWSKRLKRQNEAYWQREFGKAKIVFKTHPIFQQGNLLVYDICGHSPF